MAQIKDRPFAEVMTEAREVWGAYLGKATNEEEKDQQLSQAVPSQSSLVEYFIDEVKQLM